MPELQLSFENEPVFVDTNILVYAVAEDEPLRQQIAQSLLEFLIASQNLRTSTQVLQELYVVVTRKVKRKFTSHQALLYLEHLARCPVQSSDYTLVRDAALLSGRDAISLWDALILTAAARSAAKYLLTEDLQHGRTILGVKIVNPFHKS